MIALLCAAALASEVDLEGGYRARGQLFDSLSLNHALADSEGLAFGFDHRLLLRPVLHLGDDARMTVEVRALDGVVWGDQTLAVTSPVLGAPPTFDNDLTAPTSSTDEYEVLSDITLARAWVEFNSDIGTFGLGRQPLHWGLGLWRNDGWSVAPDFARYGDSQDRVDWELLVQDEFFVGLGVGIESEGTLGGEDDTTSFDGHLAYRTELVQAGVILEVARTTDPGFTLATVDGTSTVTLGKLDLGAEVVGQFGEGALAAIGEGVSVTSVGAALRAGLDLSPWKLDVLAGFASGDGDDRDLSLRSFTFDRDFSVGMVLFEQPMPTLAAAAVNDENDGRNLDAALTGNAVGNAIFLRPTVHRTLTEDLDVHLSWLGARASKVPASFEGRNSYGMEFGTGLGWDPVEHVRVGLDGALFLPGSTYTEFEDEDIKDLDDPVYGLMLNTLVHF